MAKKSVLTPQAEDFPRWYQDVTAKAELAENGPARGTMVIRPYGWALWEGMQREVDQRIKQAGAQNAYFPLFIPMSFLHKAAQHVEGFSPELAVVTHGGGKELEEPLVVRPTSETVINHYFSKWLQSYRDLPMLLNQWANVVRWELRPRLFLRTTEFLWQEGHTCHATEEDARAYALKILHEVYEDFMVTGLGIPPKLAPIQVVVLVGRDEDGAGEKAAALAKQLQAAGVRVELDNRDAPFGRRAVEWELKGVPIRLELGPRDIASGAATMVRRDKGEKESTPLDGLPTRIPEILDDIQKTLHEQAQQRRDERTVDAANIDEAIEAARTGFARITWDNSGELEDRLNQESISVRCLRRRDGSVPLATDEDDLVAVVARAY